MNDVLFVVVTYTPDESRERGLINLIRSLNEQHGFSNNLLIFDNASPRRKALCKIKAEAAFALCPENLGYWGALQWAMDNAEAVFGRRFAFIHPIESDLTLFNLERLGEGVAFLKARQDIDTVRTQEFSVGSKSRYLKNSWHPFKVRRSRVADYNGVTNERVRFEKTEGFQNIYVTNWHAKVPALHRFDVLRDAFEELAKLPRLTEYEFMKAMHRRNPKVALLDRGIWYMEDPKTQKLSGGWSSEALREQYGYRNSRNDVMPKEFPIVDIIKDRNRLASIIAVPSNLG